MIIDSHITSLLTTVTDLYHRGILPRDKLVNLCLDVSLFPQFKLTPREKLIVPSEDIDLIYQVLKFHDDIWTKVRTKLCKPNSGETIIIRFGYTKQACILEVGTMSFKGECTWGKTLELSEEIISTNISEYMSDRLDYSEPNEVPLETVQDDIHIQNISSTDKHIRSLLSTLRAMTDRRCELEFTNLMVLTIDNDLSVNIIRKDDVSGDEHSGTLTAVVNKHTEIWRGLVDRYCLTDRYERLAIRIAFKPYPYIVDVGVFKYEGSDPPLIDWGYKVHNLEYTSVQQNDIQSDTYPIGPIPIEKISRNGTIYDKDVRIEIMNTSLSLETVYTDKTLGRIEKALASIPEELALDITFIKQHDVTIPRDGGEIEQGYLGTFNIVPRRNHE